MIEHPWRVSPAEARSIQQCLAGKVRVRGQLPRLREVTGVDVGFEEGGRYVRAAVVSLRFPSLEVVEQRVARRVCRFPYVPGLLSFRECPAVLAALAKLHAPPQLLLCDGQGIAHPRRFGIASHLGVITGLPAIGVAKSRLIGDHGPVGDRRGDWVPLHVGDDVVGAVVRTRSRVKPLYVSVGHRVELQRAIEIVLACGGGYRLPEPTRLADRLASRRGRRAKVTRA